MSLIVKDKNFYKTVLAIAVPIALQNMVTSAVAPMSIGITLAEKNARFSRTFLGSDLLNLFCLKIPG